MTLFSNPKEKRYSLTAILFLRLKNCKFSSLNKLIIYHFLAVPVRQFSDIGMGHVLDSVRYYHESFESLASDAKSQRWVRRYSSWYCPIASNSNSNNKTLPTLLVPVSFSSHYSENYRVTNILPVNSYSAKFSQSQFLFSYAEEPNTCRQ